jgi:hypothetical protein
MSIAFKDSSCGHEKPAEKVAGRKRLPCPACGKRSKPWVALAIAVAGSLAVAGLQYAWGQNSARKKGAGTAPERWWLLFRADDPAVWNTDSRGKNLAVPLRRAPATIRYLRLRRMDTGEALILPLTRDQLLNGKPRTPEVGFWWNGTAKEEWKGRHLGIVQAPRYKFPVPRGMISVMNQGWDDFAGSGFGHKCSANDGQYYCWRGQEIPRTVFEIAVSDGPLSAAEKRYLLPQR